MTNKNKKEKISDQEGNDSSKKTKRKQHRETKEFNINKLEEEEIATEIEVEEEDIKNGAKETIDDLIDQADKDNEKMMEKINAEKKDKE